jgi:putative transposase
MENRFLGHTTYRTEYHIVWNTKYRHSVLDEVKRLYLKDLIFNTMAKLHGCEIIEINILLDHVHMILVIPPKYAISEIVGKLKGITSSKMQKRFAKLKELYPKSSSLWSPGYFVSTVGVPEQKLISYVKNQ